MTHYLKLIKLIILREKAEEKFHRLEKISLDCSWKLCLHC